MSIRPLEQPATGAVPIRLTFEPTAEGDSGPRLDVGEASATFAMSEVFEIRLLVQTTDAALDLRGLLRRPVTVLFEAEAFVPKVDGIVTRARVVSIEPAGVSRYELTVAPELSLLRLRRNHRIFAGEAVFEIASVLLHEHASKLTLSTDALGDDHPVREYTVQYGESDLHAFQRLLADEGIATFFDFAENKLVATDDTTKQSLRLDAPVRFLPPSNLHQDVPHVLELRPSRATHVEAVAIRDYDYHRPGFPIESSAGLKAADLEAYEYEVGEVADEKAAARRALHTLDALGGSAEDLACVTNCLIAPGTTFRIDGHPRVEADGELLAVSVTSRWRADASGTSEARHEIACLPATSRFRPVRLEKPRIAGVQTAVVVGDGTSEIDVDDEGRVKIELRWDRRGWGKGNTSRRVRVSQAWAGADYGFVAVPRVGDEVVVSFLDGDPDEPLIVGRVHNPVRPSPLRLPEEKTVTLLKSRSTPGGNGSSEIRIQDLAGEELFHIHAQRDFSEIVERDAATTIKRDQSITVHGDHITHTVGKGDIQYGQGFNFSTPTKGTIAAKDLVINAGTRHDDSKIFTSHAGTSSNAVDGAYGLSAGVITLSATGAIVLSCGGSKITITAGSIDIQSDGAVNIIGNPINLNP